MKIIIMILFFPLAIFLSLFLTFEVEREDSFVLQGVKNAGKGLFEYQLSHHILPATLKEIGIDEKICYRGIFCHTIQYKVSADRQNYKLTASAHGSWIAYFSSIPNPTSSYCKDKYLDGCFYMGLTKD